MCIESKKIKPILGEESLVTNPEIPQVTELVSSVIIRRQRSEAATNINHGYIHSTCSRRWRLRGHSTEELRTNFSGLKWRITEAPSRGARKESTKNKEQWNRFRTEDSYKPTDPRSTIYRKKTTDAHHNQNSKTRDKENIGETSREKTALQIQGQKSQ